MGEALVQSEVIQQAGKKPQLHQSGMSRLIKCGVQWELRNVQGVQRPPSFRLHEGTAVHRAAEHALKAKARGEAPDAEEVVAVAREALRESLSDKGARLAPDEMADGLKVRNGKAIDFVADLARYYAEAVLPIINPRSEDHVEWRWVIELPDRPFDLAGTADVVEADGTVRDLKTKTASPKSTEADDSAQLTWYAMARDVFDHALPPRLVLDHVVRTPARRELKHRPQVTVRTAEDVAAEKRRIDRAMSAIQSGVFLPANPDSWYCSAQWCEYYSDGCPFVNGKRVSAAPAAGE